MRLTVLSFIVLSLTACSDINPNQPLSKKIGEQSNRPDAGESTGRAPQQDDVKPLVPAPSGDVYGDGALYCSETDSLLVSSGCKGFDLESSSTELTWSAQGHEGIYVCGIHAGTLANGQSGKCVSSAGNTVLYTHHIGDVSSTSFQAVTVGNANDTITVRCDPTRHGCLRRPEAPHVADIHVYNLGPGADIVFNHDEAHNTTKVATK
jgi:hypothetical protein